MSAGDHLNGQQFNLPVGQVFKHPEIERHPAEWHLVNNYYSETRPVRTSSLRPTQSHLDEEILRQPPREEGPPGAIQDERGRYRLVDGHHRVARALLNGDKHIDVKVWDQPKRGAL